MLRSEELPYWLALAHIPGMTNRRKNGLLISIIEQGKISLIDFFQAGINEWSNIYKLDQKEINLFLEARQEIANYSFLVEDLMAQGYKIITLNSPDYSPVLKDNLKTGYAPQVLYVKGNTGILKEDSVAIVGSRNAGKQARQFADNIAKRASEKHQVVVSGYAKGVDQQALESALKYKGHSIIVLPQGIMTFSSGFKKFYKQIINGDLLVLSTFHPKAPWQSSLAMARNTIIYGLAKEIYVAESDDTGGTWSGVMDGLRKGRQIYVRKPLTGEKNANNQLIERGGIPVDMDGNIVREAHEISSSQKQPEVREPNSSADGEKIIQALGNAPLTPADIIKITGIKWNEEQVTGFLKQCEMVELVSADPCKFIKKDLSGSVQKKLF